MFSCWSSFLKNNTGLLGLTIRRPVAANGLLSAMRFLSLSTRLQQDTVATAAQTTEPNAAAAAAAVEENPVWPHGPVRMNVFPVGTKPRAVIELGGKVLDVATNDVVVVNKLRGVDIGESVVIEKVRSVETPQFKLVGSPHLAKDLVKVYATVIEQAKAAKEVVIKFKRRKNYRRKIGHRQRITALRIFDIDTRNVQPHLHTEPSTATPAKASRAAPPPRKASPAKQQRAPA